MLQAVTQTETKTCNACGQEKPLTNFRCRRRGSEERHAQCNECFARYTRNNRKRRRQKDIAKFTRQVKDLECSPSAVTALCVVMMRRFGGLSRFAELWKAHHDAAVAARPGSKLVSDSFKALFRLVEISSKEQDKEADFANVSDEDLECFIQEHISRELDANRN